MKAIDKPVYLIIITLLFLFSSCGESVNNSKGEFNGTDFCLMIGTDDIRSVFNLNSGVEIEQDKNLDQICYYKWTADDINYTIRLTKAKWDQKSSAEVNKTWEKQNESNYNKYDLETVQGVGDKASWSDYEKGQLRFVADGYFFYLSLYNDSSSESPEGKQDRIDKAAQLANVIIDKM
ncbi:hypothetical protein [Brumimicrobium sp.]|uniref:hypothetical protein n=1 Tax=Brumimicrobium sp. TaxID=2029867 RepID=UPI003A8F51DC